jgi:hypothetical protein
MIAALLDSAAEECVVVTDDGGKRGSETQSGTGESGLAGDPSHGCAASGSKPEAYKSGSARDDNARVDRVGMDGEDAGRGVVIPWLMAEADPGEWWKKLRRSPKRLGEVSQAAFLHKAKMMGLNVALPWGDSERYDFVVWADASLGSAGEGSGSETTSKAAGRSARSTQASSTQTSSRIFRVQVKGTGRLYMRGYEVQPVRSTRGRGKRRYTTREVDVIAAHVQPVDVWYLIPMEEVGRARSLRLYPDIESRGPLWEKWREAWEVLGCK